MQSNSYKAIVPAKINLRLAVTGRRGGLHTLDMIVCPYDKLFDEVEFIPSQNSDESGIIVVEIIGAYDGFVPKRFEGFYLPKVQAIAKQLGVCGRLRVCKGVPLGAGLGGSTASIVGALKAMLAYLENVGQSTALDDGFLLSLGSDVPCMLKGGLCRVRGVGEAVDSINAELDLDLAVEIADGGCDSAECYKLYDKLKSGEKLACDEEIAHMGDLCVDERDYSELSVREIIDIICECRNDLTLPAVTINPRIGELLDNMKKRLDFVIMSGSGSAVVGIKSISPRRNG